MNYEALVFNLIMVVVGFLCSGHPYCAVFMAGLAVATVIKGLAERS